jgi:pilus assembly protein CpaF
MSFEVIIPFLKPIEHLLASPTVSEIMVNPDGSIWIEEKGRIEPVSEVRFEEGALLTSLEVIANRFGKKLDADSPILNLRLPDGSRLAALVPPVVNPQPMMTIRKFTSRDFTMDDLIERRMLTAEQGQQLTEAIRRGDNLLISGGTGPARQHSPMSLPVLSRTTTASSSSKTSPNSTYGSGTSSLPRSSSIPTRARSDSASC